MTLIIFLLISIGIAYAMSKGECETDITVFHVDTVDPVQIEIVNQHVKIKLVDK